MVEFPVQSLRLRIAGVRPMQDQWEKKTLDLLHQCLVDQQLRVEVVESVEGLSLQVQVFLGEVDIADMLVTNEFARRNVK